MKKTRVAPEYTPAHLADELRKIWRERGPLKHFLSSSLGPQKEHYLESYGGKVLTRHYGATQIMYFERDERAKGDEGFYFCLLNVGINSGERGLVQSFIEARLNGLSIKRKREVEKIFGQPSFETAEIEFGGKRRVIEGAADSERKVERLKGVHVRVPINKLPRGKQLQVSDLLYECFYNVFALPAHRVMLNKKNANPVANDRWDSFSQGKNRLNVMFT